MGDIRGVYRFSSLMKQNKKAKMCFEIHIAGEKKLLFYIYDMIVKQIFYKRSTNHYSHMRCASPRLPVPEVVETAPKEMTDHVTWPC